MIPFLMGDMALRGVNRQVSKLSHVKVFLWVFTGAQIDTVMSSNSLLARLFVLTRLFLIYILNKYH